MSVAHHAHRDRAAADEWSHKLIGAAIEVHRALGPGLLESAYQACLCRELEVRGIPFAHQVPVAIEYKGILVENAYRIEWSSRIWWWPS